GNISVYELTGGASRSLSGHGYGVYGLASPPSHALLAAKTGDPEVAIWDLAPRRERRPYQASFEAASLAFSPDGRHLAITPRWRFDPKLDGPPLLLLNAETGERRGGVGGGVFFCCRFGPRRGRRAPGGGGGGGGGR